jgi:hypothetical protein
MLKITKKKKNAKERGKGRSTKRFKKIRKSLMYRQFRSFITVSKGRILGRLFLGKVNYHPFSGRR